MAIMLITVTNLLMTLTVGLATVLGAAMAAPQAVKLTRSRLVAGLSLSWAAASLAVNLAWALYGFAIRDLAIVPVSALSLLCYAWIAVLIVRCSEAPLRGQLARSIGVATVLLAIAATAYALGGVQVAGVTLGMLYGAQLLPAVVTVYRSVDVRGVSIATWSLALVEAALWGFYGAHRLDLGILTLATMGVLMSGLVLARLAVWHTRMRRRHRQANRPTYAIA